MRGVIRWICLFTFIASAFVAIQSLWNLRSYLASEDVFKAHYLHSTELLGKIPPLSSEYDPTAPKNGSSQSSACQVEEIPRLIHQTFKTTDVPQRWLDAQRSCQKLHQTDWTHVFWTDEDAESFLATHYPWFLPTYLDYPYAIQRADAIRYFILYHFGGIYLDLDVGCRKELTPLLKHNALLPKTHPIGVSNDVMCSAVRHPFFEQVIKSLASSNHLWGPEYTTVLFSTGPMFLTSQIVQYWRKE